VLEVSSSSPDIISPASSPSSPPAPVLCVLIHAVKVGLFTVVSVQMALLHGLLLVWLLLRMILLLNLDIIRML
jgi:hypothetical protein